MTSYFFKKKKNYINFLTKGLARATHTSIDNSRSLEKIQLDFNWIFNFVPRVLFNF